MWGDSSFKSKRHCQSWTRISISQGRRAINTMLSIPTVGLKFPCSHSFFVWNKKGRGHWSSSAWTQHYKSKTVIWHLDFLCELVSILRFLTFDFLIFNFLEGIYFSSLFSHSFDYFWGWIWRDVSSPISYPLPQNQISYKNVPWNLELNLQVINNS